MASPPPEPLVGFVIGGVQKAGTTALARYLGRHPRLLLPCDKEAHMFDAADFDDGATSAQIDARYLPLFDDASTPAALHGDATPFYLYQPRVIARMARYNPAMRILVLLRDPVERAVSHHHMERQRGHERWPLPIALLLERGRLRRDSGNFARRSSLRRHSYRARGDYARQLDVLFAHFPRSQVLLLRSDELLASPHAVVARACDFLGVDVANAGEDYAPVFAANYARVPRGSLRWRLLRWWFRRELRAMRERYDLRFD
jgi:hypothetical protein